MRRIVIGLLGASLTGPAMAQDLGQVGRLLGNQLLPQQQNNTSERDAYERGRRDAEAQRGDGRYGGNDGRGDRGRDGDRQERSSRDQERGRLDQDNRRDRDGSGDYRGRGRSGED